MRKDKEDILLKDRSSRACISAGYHLYMSNFKRIFWASWLAALVFAIVISAGGTLMILKPQLTLITLPLTVFIDALFVTYGLSALKQHQEKGSIEHTARWYSLDTHIFIRTLKVWLCMLFISIVTCCALIATSIGAINYLSTYAAFGIIGIITLMVFVLILPLAYTNIRYVLNDGTSFWSNLFSHYGTGLRRWGLIFLVVFMTGLIGCVCSIFTSLPAIILSMSASEAYKGFIFGDPYNMPSYYGWLSASVFLLIGFIQAYVILSFLFPIYYMYGSIEVHEKERNILTN